MNRLIFALLLALVVEADAFAASPPPANATVGATSIQIMPARPWNGELRRTGFAIVNDSDSKIYLAFGSPAEVGKGILLMPQGGAVTIVAGVPETAVYAIAVSGDSNRLTIMEW